MKTYETFQSIQEDGVKVCKSINSCKTADQMMTCLNLIDLYQKKWSVESLQRTTPLLVVYTFWYGCIFAYRQLKERELNIITE